MCWLDTKKNTGITTAHKEKGQDPNNQAGGRGYTEADKEGVRRLTWCF